MTIDLNSIFAKLVALGPKLPEAIPVLNDIADQVKRLVDGTNPIELLSVAMAVSKNVQKLITMFGMVPAPALTSATPEQFELACVTQRVDGHRVKWLVDFAKNNPQLIAIILGLL
jgi:hypothetical protein